MGGCCCCASKSINLNSSPQYFHYPVSEEHEPLSSHHATASAAILVDTNLDTSVPDTYHPPPAPIPYDTYVGHPSTPSSNQESSDNKTQLVLQTTAAATTTTSEDTNSGDTLETKVKNLESDESTKINADLEESKEVEDEKSDELKKNIEPMFPPLQDEEDICPTCLEEYDLENPKIITKCDHHFHLGCILEWMERSDTCPVCDQEMIFSPAIGG
ncbi:hypothetical protein ACP275_01G077700 [Erythranthe tilingii]